MAHQVKESGFAHKSHEHIITCKHAFVIYIYIFISFYHVVYQCQSPFSLFAVSSQSASLKKHQGIWIIKLKEGNYCASYGERSCEDGAKLLLMEANDNHEEEHTVAEFIEFCVNGRTSKSGEWTSKGVGKYLEGGKEAGGQLVDQRFCPRIVEGELRYNLVGDALVGIIHKKPKEGGISAVGGTGSVYTYYGPEEPLFAALTNNFLKKDLQHVMPSLELADEPLPLWWTTDFINSSPPGTKPEDEKWIVGEFLGFAEDYCFFWIFFYFLNGKPTWRIYREYDEYEICFIFFGVALKQIQGSTAPALGLAAAWLPTARTTPPLPAGMTSLRKTRQKPRDMEILWGRRPWAFCPRSEDNIDSCSSSFNNKAASLIQYDSLIAFGAELRPLPLHVSRGNI